MRNLKTVFIIVVLAFTAIDIFAQGAEVVKPPKYPTTTISGVVKENSRTRRAISYTSLREADVMWSKRVLRNIDLREKINLPLYYPDQPTPDRKSLFDVIKDAAMAGDITVFDDIGDMEFRNDLTKTEVEKKLASWDSTAQTEDVNNPGSFVSAPVLNKVTSDQITKYQIKEDWFFDKQRSVLDVRILGILVVKQKINQTTKEAAGETGLFSIYFPEARPLFATNEVYMRHNDSERRTFDDIFWKRMFSSYIIKETNVYDRMISAYTSGLDALLESERIKKEIFTTEHDLWHF